MLDDIVKLVRECGEIIKNSSAQHIEIKNNNRTDLVTEYDKKIQDILQKQLQVLMPEASFLGEEGEASYQKEGYCFVCDPIDGTTNFTQGYKHSSVSVGLLYNGQPVSGVIYNPFLDEMFTAEKGKGACCNGKRIQTTKSALENTLSVFGTGSDDMNKTWTLVKKYFANSLDIRRSGSGALDLCNVACGRSGIFFELKLKPWDFAAGNLIVEEAGGLIRSWNGDKIDDYFVSRPIFALANSSIPIYDAD